jgi:hypothetical protein
VNPFPGNRDGHPVGPDAGCEMVIILQDLSFIFLDC